MNLESAADCLTNSQMVKNCFYLFVTLLKVKDHTTKQGAQNNMDSNKRALLDQVYLNPEVHVHDMYPFHFLHGISGLLPGYPSRGMIYPHVAAVCVANEQARSNIEACHTDHQRMQVGAKDLILVSEANISQAITDSPELLRIMQSFTEAGHDLDFFIRRDVEQLPQALGLRPEQITAPHPKIAVKLDDKLEARVLANGTGVFAPWRFVSTIEEIKRVRRLIEHDVADRGLPETDTIFLKRPGFDGGDGILRWTPEKDRAEVSDFLRTHLHHGLIAEAGYPRDRFDMHEVAVVLLVEKDRHRVLFSAEQLTDGDAHIGDRTAFGESVIPAKEWIVARPIVDVIGRQAVQLGIGVDRPRTIGVDLIVVHHAGEVVVFVLEVNARKIAADSAAACAMQVIDRFGGNVAVTLLNTQVPKGMAYKDVVDNVLNGRAYQGDGKPGIALANAASLAEGKVSMYMIAGSLQELYALEVEQADQSELTP